MASDSTLDTATKQAKGWVGWAFAQANPLKPRNLVIAGTLLFCGTAGATVGAELLFNPELVGSMMIEDPQAIGAVANVGIQGATTILNGGYIVADTFLDASVNAASNAPEVMKGGEIILNALAGTPVSETISNTAGAGGGSIDFNGGDFQFQNGPG